MSQGRCCRCHADVADVADVVDVASLRGDIGDIGALTSASMPRGMPMSSMSRPQPTDIGDSGDLGATPAYYVPAPSLPVHDPETEVQLKQPDRAFTGWQEPVPDA